MQGLWDVKGEDLGTALLGIADLISLNLVLGMSWSTKVQEHVEDLSQGSTAWQLLTGQ